MAHPHDHHTHAHHTEESNLKTGLLGLAIALVFLAIVMGFSYWLAVR